jgi:glycerate 2-kinase
MRPTLRETLKDIYSCALKAVDPEAAVLRFLNRDSDALRVAGASYDLDSFRRIILVGFGKAGVPMAAAVEQVLGERLDAGLVVVKYGHGGELRRTRVLEASHPEPDQAGERGATEILELLEAGGEKDLLLVVVSGGGSALVPAPVEGVSLADKQRTTAALLRCGATIHELNAIRKHLSRIKGGGLLRHARGATVIALMLSDVVGDDMSTIASGPTVPDPTTFTDCLEIARSYGLEADLPPAVVEHFEAGAAGDVAETLKPGTAAASRVQNVIVGSNFMALAAAAERAQVLGFAPLILSSSIEGNTADIARLHVALAREVVSTGHPLPKPCCLISGGETTLKVTGTGKGGRNQEFVLWCAREATHWDHRDLLFASLGSDGTDGPTDAAGAVAGPETAGRAKEQGLSIEEHLARNDSYHFFEPLGDLIMTGPTRTNVMDLRFVLIG